MNHYLFECTAECTIDDFCLFAKEEQFIIEADNWEEAKRGANALTAGHYDFLYMMEGTEAATSGIEIF